MLYFTVFFCFAFKNIGICSVLCISGPKSIGIYSISCVFAWLPPTTLKRKNAVIYSILWISKSEKSSEKCFKTALFSDFRYPPNRGRMGECSWRRLWATRIPAKKLSPTLLKDFWCFSGPGVGGSAAWGAPHHRALVALGQATRVEPAEPNLRSRPGAQLCGPFCGYVGLCWPTLVYLAGNVGPSCGYVGLCWPQVDLCWAKRSEKWEQQKKHCKTQDILMVGGLSWGYVGPSWGYVGLSWGQCGPILGLRWPILGLCWPILGLCWPMLGLCWPILGAMLPHLGAMFAHLKAYVGPCWPILSHKLRKMRKNAKSTKHRKTR